MMSSRSKLILELARKKNETSSVSFYDEAKHKDENFLMEEIKIINSEQIFPGIVFECPNESCFDIDLDNITELSTTTAEESGSNDAVFQMVSSEMLIPAAAAVIAAEEKITNNNDDKDEQSQLMNTDPDYIPEDEELNSRDEDDAMPDKNAAVAIMDSLETGFENLREKLLKKRRHLAEQMTHNKSKHPLVLISCNCKKYNCCTVININQRQAIHNAYWSLDRHTQRLWLANHVLEEKSKRKVENSKRNYTRKYFVDYEGDQNEIKKAVVCQKFFLNTLGYKYDTVIHSMLQSTKDCHGVKKLIPAKDKRGLAIPPNKVDRDNLVLHINSFKPMPSHYKRSHTPNRRYLPPDLTVKIMHQDYLEKHPNNKVSYEIYRSVVQSQNIAFKDLAADKCSTCLEYELNENFENREQLKEEHLKQANAARKKYNEDFKINDDSILVFAADLQKVQLLPRMPDIKDSFFLSRLITFNETFASMQKKGNHTCSLWHEAIAGRDASEITSAYIKFFENHTDANTLIVWMDNCTGQNKNWVLYSSLISYVNQDACNTSQIIIRYLVPGHTYMAADGLHGRIEQVMRKKKNIQDFEDFIAVCTASSKRMDVVPLNYDDFRKYENKIKTRNSNTGSIPYLKDIVEVAFTKGDHGFKYKTDFNQENYQIAENILKKKVTLDFPVRNDFTAEYQNKKNWNNKIISIENECKSKNILAVFANQQSVPRSLSI